MCIDLWYTKSNIEDCVKIMKPSALMILIATCLSENDVKMDIALYYQLKNIKLIQGLNWCSVADDSLDMTYNMTRNFLIMYKS